MSELKKNVTLTGIVNGKTQELMAKTSGDQVYLNSSTKLSEKIAEIVAAVNARMKIEDVNAMIAEIQDDINNYVAENEKMSLVLEEVADTKADKADVDTQIDNLRQEMLGDTPVEAYNTFTELATYVSEHKEVSDALTAAIGTKAEKSEVEVIQKSIDDLGALSSKDIISESDMDTLLQEKINTTFEGNHSHENREVLDSITNDKVTEWNDKSVIYVGNTQPENITPNDLWFRTV